MATTKKPAAAAKENEEGFVTVKLPREAGADEIVYVSVNSIGYAIKRGEPIKVPKAVANEIRRSERAKEKLWATKDSYLEAAKK